MFSEKEKELMKKIGLSLDFSRISIDDFAKIEEVVGDYYTKLAQGTEKETEEILLCESILDVL